jgi:hypothetical protein
MMANQSITTRSGCRLAMRIQNKELSDYQQLRPEEDIDEYVFDFFRLIGQESEGLNEESRVHLDSEISEIASYASSSDDFYDFVGFDGEGGEAFYPPLSDQATRIHNYELNEAKYNNSSNHNQESELGSMTIFEDDSRDFQVAIVERDNSEVVSSSLLWTRRNTLRIGTSHRPSTFKRTR